MSAKNSTHEAARYNNYTLLHKAPSSRCSCFACKDNDIPTRKPEKILRVFAPARLADFRLISIFSRTKMYVKKREREDIKNNTESPNNFTFVNNLEIVKSKSINNYR